MKWFLLMPLTLSACTSPTPLPQERTAYQVYSSLGWHDKNIAGEFYSRGKSDEIKSLYWRQRGAQEVGTASDEPKLKHKYFNVPVPEHVDPSTGTVIESSNKAIEIVELWNVVPSHGRKLFIVK